MKRNQLRRKIDRLAGRYFMFVCVAIVRLLPHRGAYLFARGVGRFAFFAARKHRKLAINNLKLAFGDSITPEKRFDIARETFCSITWGAAETARLALAKDVDVCLKRNISIEGKRNLDRALGKGKGAIFISAHFGNFTLMARRLNLEGYDFNLIMRFADDPGAMRLWADIMNRIGIKAISARPKRKAAVKSLKWLKSGRPIFFHTDQNKTDGEYVDFFGHPAGTAEGPARLHIRTGSPILCAFIVRLDDKRHKIVITPELKIKLSNDEKENVHRITQAYTKVIEQFVRMYPEQWWWLHNRWKGMKKRQQAKKIRFGA